MLMKLSLNGQTVPILHGVLRKHRTRPRRHRPARYKQMMTQSTLATSGFDAHSKTTRKAAFVARMDKLMPWTALTVESG